ncbi:MAG: helix-turn-helix transcriptional regulator [Planctomycetota bacterium]
MALGVLSTLTTGEVEMTVSDDLRAAVKEAMRRGVTRYRISRDAKVDHSALSRFLTEDRDLRLSTVDALASYLGLELRGNKPETGV